MSRERVDAKDPREPFASWTEAEAAAAEIHRTTGWDVVEITAGPGGPPRTRYGGHLISGPPGPLGRRDPWARVPSLPPRVVVRRPDGQRATIGSWARWEALRAAWKSGEQRDGAS